MGLPVRHVRHQRVIPLEHRSGRQLRAQSRIRAGTYLQRAAPGGVFGRQGWLQGADGERRGEVEDQVVGVGDANAGDGGIRIKSNWGWVGN